MFGSFLWAGTGLYYSIMPFFSLLLFFSLDRNSGMDKWYFLSVISAICCYFSFSGGVFIWIGGLTVLILKRDSATRLKIALWVIIAGVLFYLNYFFLEPHISNQPQAGISVHTGLLSHIFENPLQILINFLSVCGSNVISHSDYAIYVGLFISGSILLTMYINRENLDLNNSAVWYGVITYSCATIVGLILLRAQGTYFFIPDVRHFSSTFFLLFGLFLLIIQLALTHEKVRMDHTISFSPHQLNSSCIMWIIVGLFTSMLILGFFFHIQPGIEYGRSWFLQGTDTLTTFYNEPVITDDFLKKIIPEPPEKSWGRAYVPDEAKYFREKQLGVFDKTQSFHFDSVFINIVRTFIITRWP
jgi:hypothetical protein